MNAIDALSVPPPPRPPALPPLGELPEDRLPISGPLGAVEGILRHPRRIMFHLHQGTNKKLILALALVALCCTAVYGLVVGTFSGGEQLWVAPVKVLMGLMIAGLICFPSLYIFSCLSGSEARLDEVAGLVGGLLALAALLLLGFAPVAWIFSQSTKSLPVIGAMHLIFWMIAVYFGVRFVVEGFKQLRATAYGNLKVWIVIFVLVTMQMTTTLRPIIGTSPTFFPAEKKFFVAHWFESME